MERTITLIAAIGAFVAAGFAAYTAYNTNAELAQFLSDERARKAIADLERFDKEMAKTVNSFACLSFAAQLTDEDAKSALFSGKRFEGPEIAGCREKERTVSDAGLVSYTANDARSIRRHTLKVLNAHEAIFSHSAGGLTDCETLDQRYGDPLSANNQALLTAIETVEAHDEAAAYPAFKAYLENGCG